MKAMLLGVAFALLGVSAAEAIDCSKAKDPIDLAICTNPDVLESDDAMSAAYQDSPLACTIGYDVLRPLLKAGFPLPG